MTEKITLVTKYYDDDMNADEVHGELRNAYKILVRKPEGKKNTQDT
jgi:hypothetical protein